MVAHPDGMRPRCKRRAGEDFKELFIPSITPDEDGVRGSQGRDCMRTQFLNET